MFKIKLLCGFLHVCVFIFLFHGGHCNYVDNYYCGEDNCYDLLQTTRDASKADIKRAFRAVALKNHPDKFQLEEDKKNAGALFLKIQTAYDILRDDEARADYDYMLDNPDQFYMNYYRAWRRRNVPNVDVRVVIAVAISLISLFQYYNGLVKYEEAIKYFSNQPKYRIKATEEAKKEGLIKDEKKKVKGKTKEEIKQEEEKIIREIIEKKMDIRGVYAKPTIKDVLWIQLVLLPYWVGQYVHWNIVWVWRFWIKKEEYGINEKLHLIRKYLKMSQGQFDALEEHDKENYLKEELWICENFKVWKEKKDVEVKAKMAQSGKYKAYRRYLKANGPGRMYFDD